MSEYFRKYIKREYYPLHPYPVPLTQQRDKVQNLLQQLHPIYDALS